MILLLLVAPWLGALVFLMFVARTPSELPPPWSAHESASVALEEAGSATSSGSTVDRPDRQWPLVSVIVPARNEIVNIESCLSSIAGSAYPDFEIIVVDDRSDDGTGEVARGLSPGRARALVVVEGERLPEGWLGKPWACWQGAQRAAGEVLLFTDADTTHAADLLARAVMAMEDEGADLLTLVGRQLMETFWERLVQPQVFLTMLFRFPDFERVAANGRWRDAIANGQYILMPRRSYDAIDGHRGVKDEVVEDLALAQTVKRAGLKLRIRSAESGLSTRMYRSLGQLVEGWSKNIVTGGLQSVHPAVRPIVAPISLVLGIGLWLAPPLALAGAMLGVGPPGLLTWAATVCAVSVVLWARFSHQMGAPAGYGLLYPLGASVGVFIFLRSWVRGRDVEWKGRRYRLPPLSDRP